MVLVKIAIVAAAFAGLLGLAQNQNWWQRAGLMSRCVQTTAPYGSQRAAGQWWSCREGVISGFPSLVRYSCDSKGIYGKTQIWYCPTPIEQP